MPEEEQKRGKAVHFACGCDAISLNKTCLLGGGLLPTVTTRIIAFLVGDCYTTYFLLLLGQLPTPKTYSNHLAGHWFFSITQHMLFRSQAEA